MKKVLYFIAAVAVLASSFACQKNDKEKIDDQTGTSTRIAQLRDAWDWWDFVYDANGVLTKVDRDNGDRVWNFAWSGKTATVTGRDDFSFTLGDNGMIATLNWKDNSVYTYTYDQDGHMTEAKKDGAVVSTIEITNGNITKITEGEQVITFEYGSEENVYGIQHQYQDDFNVMLPKWYRFLIESGMLGKASKNVPTSFTKDGDKICDYVFETVVGGKEDGFLEGKNYIIMKTKKKPEDEEGKVVHKYCFEEYTPAK